MWMDMFLVDDEIKQVGFNPQGSNIKYKKVSAYVSL